MERDTVNGNINARFNLAGFVCTRNLRGGIVVAIIDKAQHKRNGICSTITMISMLR